MSKLLPWKVLSPGSAVPRNSWWTWFHRGGSFRATSGEQVEIPRIPELPICGMQGTDGISNVFKTLAHDSGFKLFASLAPGYKGVLETALPDAAHAAQRRQIDRTNAKKRGGSGGRKAQKARTAELPVM